MIFELKELGKPFLVVLNSAHPQAERAKSIQADIAARYDVTCVAANCLEISREDVTELIQSVLYELPIKELDLFLPPWVDALPYDHPIKSGLYSVIREKADKICRIRDVKSAVDAMGEYEGVSGTKVTGMSLGTGLCTAALEVPRALFYGTLSEQSGFPIRDDGDLMSLLTGLSRMKEKYDKVAAALDEVYTTGYGIVAPSTDELALEEPEIVKQGGQYGVRLKASAPSIHMIRANIETEVSPIVGTEKQSEEMVHYLLREFEGDPSKIWQSKIFGKSFHELVSEDLSTKLKRMPEDARGKLQETLQRIINEGSGGLICIIL
jgi:stage IV sporulation protein A